MAAYSHCSMASRGRPSRAIIARSRFPTWPRYWARWIGWSTNAQANGHLLNCSTLRSSRTSKRALASSAPVPKPISMQPFPDREALTPASMARSGLCVGCGSCAERMRWDRNGFLKPDPPTSAAPRFAHTCPFSPAAPSEDVIAAERFGNAPAVDRCVGRFEAAYVGYAVEDPFRPNGSSGGLTSWVAADLLRTGMVDGVGHVVPTDPMSG